MKKEIEILKREDFIKLRARAKELDRNNLTKEEKFLIENIKDRFFRAKERYTVSNTGFLKPRERMLALLELETYFTEEVKILITGGYRESERKCVFFLPEFLDFEESEVISAIRVTKQNKAKELKHGDYLGSLLGLGISRDKIGDILVGNLETDILVLSDISEFLLLNYNKVGNVSVDTKVIALEELNLVEAKEKDLSGTVMSLRLDNIVSFLFGISRTKASEYISQGRVFLNDIESKKKDRLVEAGDKVVLRGKGKGYLKEIGNKSKKGRTYIEGIRYS